MMIELQKFTLIEQAILKAYCDDCKEVAQIALDRHRAPTTISTTLNRIRLKIGATNSRHMVKLYWQWRSAADREVDSWRPDAGA